MVRKFFISLLFIFVFVLNVKADCDSKEVLRLNTEAASVNANYEITQVLKDYQGNLHPELPLEMGKVLDGGYSILDIVTFKLNNVTDNIYVTITNQEDSYAERIDYNKTENGSYSFEVPDTNKIRNYVIKVYSNNSKCLDEDLRTINVATPMYNALSDMVACQNNDVYYCQKYITVPLSITEDDIAIDYSQKNHANEIEEVVPEKNNRLFVLVSLGIIGFLVIAIIVTLIIKKKRKII